MFSKFVKEQDRVGTFIGYLNRRGVNCWRNQSGKVQTIRGNWMHFGKEGSPDIVGYLPVWHKLSGGFLGIEVKKDKKHLSDGQILFAKEIRETKYGLYITARHVEDLEEAIFGIRSDPLPF